VEICNLQGYYGMTALMYAAQGGHFQVAKLLVENGADVNKQDGMTALMYAAQRGRFEVAKLLVENGADINKQVSNDIDSLKENNANC